MTTYIRRKLLLKHFLLPVLMVAFLLLIELLIWQKVAIGLLPYIPLAVWLGTGLIQRGCISKFSVQFEKIHFTYLTYFLKEKYFEISLDKLKNIKIEKNAILFYGDFVLVTKEGCKTFQICDKKVYEEIFLQVRSANISFAK